MNRREFIKLTGAGTVGLTLANWPEMALAAPKKVKLTILHTNDTHSRIEPFPNDGRAHAGMGGMARRAALVKQIRQQEENVLLLDSGDIFQGTPYFNFFGGELEFTLMSDMGYDAATLGNHDFDNGLDGLLKQLPHAKFPFLTANYDFSKTILAGKTQPYRVFRKEGIKIGVFGLGIELNSLVSDRNFGNTKYHDPVAAAKEMSAHLRKSEECDFVICLSHLGYHYDSEKISDQKLAAQVSGIDLILGGHTHTFMNQPEKVVSPDGSATLINQVGWAGINLGRLDVEFERGRKNKILGAAVLPVSEKAKVFSM